MASIGRTHHLKCIEGCGKRRPYWSDRCKQHRIEHKAKQERISQLNAKGAK